MILLHVTAVALYGLAAYILWPVTAGRGTSSRRFSHAGSVTRCWISIAQPSVTAMSPSRFASIGRSGEVCA